ncbi:MAG: sigma factor [Eubacteriales bacterium]|nr:sigma factor [Eubacteriales bacterium]
MKSFPSPLTASKEQYYLQKYTEGDLEAKHILIEHNLRLVAHIVKKYQTMDDDTDDLLSIGTIGLIKSIVTFDPDKRVRLGTYAARCIEKAMPSLRLHFVKRRKKTHLFHHGEFTDNSENNLAFFIRSNMANLHIRFNMSMTSLSRFPLGFLLPKNICLSILLLIV